MMLPAEKSLGGSGLSYARRLPRDRQDRRPGRTRNRGGVCISEGAHREANAGLVDQKSFYVETAEDVAERIRIALKYVPAEKLWVNPDCGFNPTPHWVALPKLRSMVEGARIVRPELRFH